MNLRFPAPLVPGDTVAVIAPSSGVREPLHPRLDRALDALRARGLRIVEGASLRTQAMGASAPAAVRAAELQHALEDPAIAAVLPPWGGERAIELLPLLDFDRLAACRPKWFSGFSDLSTLQLPLLTISGWASLHGPNLMELGAETLDATTSRLFDMWFAGPGTSLAQAASPMHQAKSNDWAAHPAAGYALDLATRVRRLDGGDAPLTLQGRLIGGCLDTVSRLAGSRFGDVPAFARRCADDGVLLFLENAELTPFELARALHGLRLNGWFDRLRGVLVGRHAVADDTPAGGFDLDEALRSSLGALPVPVLLDLDIGHVPPQWSLVQGAAATVSFDGQACTLVQQLS
jgi:muramoyltetrapeptide carboxypeptidase LdcA involved in peptidoglycan recycling